MFLLKIKLNGNNLQNGTKISKQLGGDKKTGSGITIFVNTCFLNRDLVFLELTFLELVVLESFVEPEMCSLYL